MGRVAKAKYQATGFSTLRAESLMKSHEFRVISFIIIMDDIDVNGGLPHGSCGRLFNFDALP